jgi:hypothetical protein
MNTRNAGRTAGMGKEGVAGFAINPATGSITIHVSSM